MGFTNAIPYGIKNCDTMKRARAWLGARAIIYEFHDYKTDGIDCTRLKQWNGAGRFRR